jgi:hypothetical protein
MFAFILLLLDLPSYEDIYKHLKKDFKKIIKNKKGEKPL